MVPKQPHAPESAKYLLRAYGDTLRADFALLRRVSSVDAVRPQEARCDRSFASHEMIEEVN